MIDYFARLPILQFQGRDQHPTKLGSIFTFLLIVAMTFLSYQISKDLWQKQFPSVSQSTMLQVDNIPLEDYPILFTMYSSEGIQITDILDYISIQAHVVQVDNQGIPTKQIRKFSSCQIVFPKYTLQDQKVLQGFTNSTLVNQYCLDFQEGDFIRNGYSSFDSSAIVLSFTYCYESESCKSPEETIKLMQNAYISINVIEDYLDYNNQFQPVQKILSPKNVIATFTMNKQVIFTIGQQVLYSFQGIVTQDTILYESRSISNRYQDSADLNPQGALWNIWFCSSNLKQKTNRYYLTLGEALGKIVGYFGFFSLGIGLILHNYENFSFQYDFVKFLDIYGYNILENNKGGFDVQKSQNFGFNSLSLKKQKKYPNIILLYFKQIKEKAQKWYRRNQVDEILQNDYQKYQSVLMRSIESAQKVLSIEGFMILLLEQNMQFSQIKYIDSWVENDVSEKVRKHEMAIKSVPQMSMLNIIQVNSNGSPKNN